MSKKNIVLKIYSAFLHM